MSRDIRYTTTYDVPWDWAHRYPPNVAPSERRALVPSMRKFSKFPERADLREGYITERYARSHFPHAFDPLTRIFREHDDPKQPGQP